MPGDVLSYHDVEPEQSGEPETVVRTVYKVAVDMDADFDAEMARRRGEDTREAGAAGEGPDEDGFGFGQTVSVTDELLDDLQYPPAPELGPGFQREMRPSAIFIYSRLLGLLPTSSILRYATSHLNISVSGFEWINDWSGVFVFSSPAAATSAFATMLLHPQEIEGENGVPEALDYLADSATSLEVAEAAAEFVLQPRAGKPLPANLFTKNPLPSGTPIQSLLPFLRFATRADVKSQSSRQESLWYAVHGERAGKEGVESRSFQEARQREHDWRRRPRGMQHEEGTSLGGRLGKRGFEDLDEQMDDYLRRRSRPGVADGRAVKDLPRRGRGSAAAADLDAELEAFMRNDAPDEADTSVDFVEGDTDMGLEPAEGRSRKKRRSSPGPAAGARPLGPDVLASSSDAHHDDLRLPTPAGDTVRDGDSDEEPLAPDEEWVEEVVEMIDEDTGKKIKRVERVKRKKRRVRGKGMWGVLFNRLV